MGFQPELHKSWDPSILSESKFSRCLVIAHNFPITLVLLVRVAVLLLSALAGAPYITVVLCHDLSPFEFSWDTLVSLANKPLPEILVLSFSRVGTAGEQLVSMLATTLHVLRLKTAIKSPLRFLFPRLSNPNSSRLSSPAL